MFFPLCIIQIERKRLLDLDMGNRLNVFRDGIREVFYKVLFFYKEYIYKHEEKPLKK